MLDTAVLPFANVNVAPWIPILETVAFEYPATAPAKALFESTEATIVTLSR